MFLQILKEIKLFLVRKVQGALGPSGEARLPAWALGLPHSPAGRTLHSKAQPFGSIQSSAPAFYASAHITPVAPSVP